VTISEHTKAFHRWSVADVFRNCIISLSLS
jgi:hypothetical protein